MTAPEAVRRLHGFAEERPGPDAPLELLSIDDAEVLASLVFTRTPAGLDLDASFPGPERRKMFLRVRDQQDVAVRGIDTRRAERLIEMLAWGDLSGVAAELGRPWL